MQKQLVIQSSPKGADIALLSDGKLVEIHHEHVSGEFQVGEIHLGKVKKILTGLNAAFVDVGYQKDAFLHYLDLGPDIRSFNSYSEKTLKKRQHTSDLGDFPFQPQIEKTGTIDQVLKPGQQVMVQIVKEPISTKGPRLTSQLSIPGRYLILLPFSNVITVSKKIKDKDERKRLKGLLRSIKPKNFGLIVRTVTEGKSVTEIDADLRELLNRWRELFKNLSSGQRKLLGELDKAESILRDMLNESFEQIIVDNDSIYKQLHRYLSTFPEGQEKMLRLFKNSSEAIFDHYTINRQLNSLFGNIVNMGGGSYLVIEHTEAMHVIDVNSGRKRIKDDGQEENALKTNLEAAEEIARQLRLRDMGGIVVIDFIDLRVAANRRKVVDHMRDCMKEDRAKHTILPISKFGLMQITRQRVRPETNHGEKATCPVCKGTGEAPKMLQVAEDISTRFEEAAPSAEAKSLRLAVHPYLAAYLNQGFPSQRLKWMWKYKKWISIVSKETYSLTQFDIFDQSNNPL